MLRAYSLGKLASLLCGLSLLLTVGCAGPRLRSRLFPTEMGEAAAEDAPHYVSGQRPLPSQQAVHPASLAMPERGQYDAQTVQTIRGFPRNSYGGSTSRNCFS